MPKLPPLGLLLLGLWAAASLAAGGGVGCSSPPALNALVDRDHDGLPDAVRVGDFDGDGLLEMNDLQDAMDALTDPGPKQIDVAPGVFVFPTNPARPGRTHAILELRSYTSLVCSPRGDTVLQVGSPVSQRDYAVVGNDDHVNGNDEVEIRNCDIDGGAPPSYASNGFLHTRRMGVYFRRTRHSSVTFTHVHDTVHTGLYTSNSTGDRFANNLVERAGGWGDTAGLRQPCIYLFAFSGGAVSDFVASDNTLRQCGHSGLNTRADDSNAPGDVVRNVLWERNTVEDALVACASLRGVDGGLVRSLTCTRTGALFLHRGSGAGYRFEGNDNANSNLTLEDVLLRQANGQYGLDVGAWVDGLVLRRVTVDGTRDAAGEPLYRDCARVERPLRNALFEDVTLRDCGRAGASFVNLPGALGDASETLTFRRLAVEDVDQVDPLDAAPHPGLDFVDPQSDLVLEDVTLAGATAPELRFQAAAARVALRRVDVDSVDPGWLGPYGEAAAPACGAALAGRWLTTLDAAFAGDCQLASGRGALRQRCGCRDGAWYPITTPAEPGIEFASGAAHANVRLEDVTVRNARGVTGVRVGGSLFDFEVIGIAGADDQLASDLEQRSAADFEATSGFSVSGASCIGTQAGVPCIE